MLFNSYGFAVFLPAAFLIYWAVPHRYRYIVLTCLSLVFYMFGGPAYVLLIIADAFITYEAAIFSEKTEDKKKKKAVFVTALLLCLGMLAFFKYFTTLAKVIGGVE